MQVDRRKFLGLALLAAASGCVKPPTPRPRTFWGQWVWSERDRAIFLESRREVSDLMPAVWVSTVSFEGGEMVQRLALSPAIEPAARVGILVRFDESLHKAWDVIEGERIAAELAAKLKTLLGHVAATDVSVAEVQLDYDCPMRRLPRWAAVVRALTAGPLTGHTVWLTSLVAHIQERAFGELFRQSVRGHILQVFDTGDRADAFSVETVAALATRHRIPFRLGLGAFERARNGRVVTDHRRWFAAVRPLSRSRSFDGAWVFAAGYRWTPLRGQVA